MNYTSQVGEMLVATTLSGLNTFCRATRIVTKTDKHHTAEQRPLHRGQFQKGTTECSREVTGRCLHHLTYVTNNEIQEL